MSVADDVAGFLYMMMMVMVRRWRVMYVHG
jgi:hypothetical protein